MLSESARMSSAAEARFRVQARPSTPRATTVIALDAAGEAVVRRLAAAGWKYATFFTAADGGEVLSSFGEAQNGPEPVEGSNPASGGSTTQDPPCIRPRGALSDLAGHSRSLIDEVDTADLVVLVAGPGGHAHPASLIGQACNRRHVTTTGFIVGVASSPEIALSKTLAQVRPWSLMVVIANSDEYIDDMLAALRA